MMFVKSSFAYSFITALSGALVRLLAMLAVLLPVCTASAVLAEAAEYKLDTGDKVQLRVFEWRAQVDQLFEWEALNGEFQVGVSGAISLPLLGDVPASGLSTSEFADGVSGRMTSQLGIQFPPRVAVEVSQYRPFYITGAIATPGAYQYQPGLTVLRAISIAGGLPRARFERLGREVITGEGAIAELVRTVQELQVRKARLSAELQEVETIDLPEPIAAVKSRPDIARIIEQEKGIFNARRTAVASQIQTLNRLKTFLAEEVKALRAQLELKKGELASVNDELDSVKTLVDKGLSPKVRLFNLERMVSNLASERLQLETMLLRAQQEISRTEIEIEATTSKNTMEVTTALREAEAELEDAIVQLQTQDRLLHETSLSYPGLASSQTSDAGEMAKYIIVRVNGDSIERVAASEETAVLPGDTIKVEIPLPDMASDLITANISEGTRSGGN
jgi:polysaccharide export outer membrane protein/exopolysaccharide production protein ExoF